MTVLRKPPGKSVKTVFRLRRAIAAFRPDLVHTHNLGPLLYTVLATGFGRTARILHGEHGQLVGRELRPLRLAFRRFLYLGCAGIHTVSAGQRDQLVSCGVAADRVSVVRNGVDTERFSPGNSREARDRLGLPLDAFVMGIVSRLSPNKRHDLLVRACAELRREGRDVHVLVVGDGPVRGSIEQLANGLQISEAIHLAGHLADPVPGYQAMDLFVLPSCQEGLCNAVLEAMSCGLPVLTSNACGNAEVIEHEVDGWTFPLQSSSELADRVRSLLGDRRHLDAMGQAVRNKVERDFRASETSASYAKVYRDMALG